MTQEEIRNELEIIRRASSDGRLHARAVRDAVRGNPRHPLRPFFTWSRNAALDKLQVIEARRLIRHVYLTNPAGDFKPAAPEYVSLDRDRLQGGGYRPLAQVVQRKDLLDSLKQTAVRELRDWIRRYRLLKDLHDVMQEVWSVEHPQNPPVPPATMPSLPGPMPGP